MDLKVPRYIVADKQHLRQVFINLLSNAIKFTPAGQITLAVKFNRSWKDENSKAQVCGKNKRKSYLKKIK